MSAHIKCFLLFCFMEISESCNNLVISDIARVMY